MNVECLAVNTLAVCPASSQAVITKAIELRPTTGGDLAKKALWWNCPRCLRWHKFAAPTETSAALFRYFTLVDKLGKQ